MPSPFLSVVIPVFNEAENVEPLLREVVAALDGRWPYEVIFTDDCSADATLAELQKLKAVFPQLRVVQHLVRSGQSAAVRSGVKVAQGDWIATLDGDGQNDPADIPALFDHALKGGADLGLVGGLRLKRQDNWSKKIATKIGNGVRQFLLRDGCRDTGCGLKVFRREAFLDMPFFAALHRFLPALFQSRGWKTEFLPVNHRHRLRGVSKYGNLQRGLVGIVDLLGVLWLRARARAPKVREL
jgi:dolichol-phosphate mannosyltransferase